MRLLQTGTVPEYKYLRSGGESKAILVGVHENENTCSIQFVHNNISRLATAFPNASNKSVVAHHLIAPFIKE